MNNLPTAWKQLVTCWEKSGEHWDDRVRDEMERRYWVRLQTETQATLRELDQLGEVINQARRIVK